jgi:DNA-binding MarR family transcriptional regulator
MINLGVAKDDRGSTAVMASNIADRRQSLDAAEKKKLGAMLQGLTPFITIRHTLPMQYVVAFLLVALEEGKGVVEYSKQAGVSQSVMSRHLLDLGDKDRLGGPGYGLVTMKQDPTNLRRRPVVLTDKGRAIAGAIIRAMGSA